MCLVRSHINAFIRTQKPWEQELFFPSLSLSLTPFVQIVAGASVKVKRVMAAISFIGVSILSSAVTTILAILPLLGTRIQLFTRFGEILLLDTAVAILYTFIICGNCLAFFGPPLSQKVWKKVLNAVLTVSCTVGLYLLILLVLYIVSRTGHYIPAADGSSLF